MRVFTYILGILYILNQQAKAQEFNQFLKEYIQKNHGSDSAKLNTTVLIKLKPTNEISFGNGLSHPNSLYDSTIQIQKIPFHYRADSFFDDKADCLCQENGVSYMRNRVTHFETKKRDKNPEVNFTGESDLIFFDSIVGWQGISNHPPTVKDTIIDKQTFFKLEHLSRNRNYYIHLIEKTSYRHLSTIMTKENGEISMKITRDIFKKSGNILYPTEIINEVYVGNLIVRTFKVIEAITFDVDMQTEGVFDCRLLYKDIKLKK
ncbi:hypothetical protein [Runella zeae]|uniref:hypothetical protein n=1 Tax=Runella zeae TaxID=94255 RepID=UPI0003F58537|nr:hypothetical protein [Runella zeae]